MALTPINEADTLRDSRSVINNNFTFVAGAQIKGNKLKATLSSSNWVVTAAVTVANPINLVHVYRNGILQFPTDDYGIVWTSGQLVVTPVATWASTDLVVMTWTEIIFP